MKIVNVVCAKGMSGFFFDDQRAIKNGARLDGAAYHGSPDTPGFKSIRQAGEAICVMIELEDGQVAWGDCAAVQYCGAGGRDPLFLADAFIPVIENHIRPLLVNHEVTGFRPMAEWIDHLTHDGRRLHTAIRYGVTQAILDAVARSTNRLMCEVVADEYGLTVADHEIPIFTQSGDSLYDNADKMILKGAQVLPHALINNVASKLGQNGEKLLAYVHWLRDRILQLRTGELYSPVIHIDVYGTIGMIFGPENVQDISSYLSRLAHAASPFQLRVEGPVDLDGREQQMLAMKTLTRMIDDRMIPVEIVADEWCNTLEDIQYFADNRAGHMIQIKTPDLGGINNGVEAVLHCRSRGVRAYQGGTCNETDRSAQICVHLAMAAQPDQILAKPGMGVDEAYMITYNEMQRILALRKAHGRV